MKFVILSAIFVISALATPTRFGDAGEYEKIPDGFGGFRHVNVDEEQEISPMFDVQRDVVFLLFTRFNPTVPQVLRSTDLSTVANSHFDVSRPTRVLIHGWQGGANADINILTTAGYLRSYDVNVIVVDWGVGANNINYIASRNAVNPVGAWIAEFLDTLRRNQFFPDFSRLALIGHSLGAHIAGATGKRTTTGTINTIIGLDPAGPLFNANEPANRLASGDAEYTEAIHTDVPNLGIGDPIADVDFYPNGGTGMPGCLTSICDHNQVIFYFVETLNSDRLWGRRCANIAQMNSNQCTGAGASMGGEPSNFRNNIDGIFRMPTNANSPFGIGPF